MRAIALGDSITEGYLCNPKESWVHLAGKGLGIEIYNLGVCGDMTLNLRRRFRHEVAKVNPTHCIIMGGVNDAFCAVDLADYSENIKILGELCLQANIIPILGIPTPVLAFPEEFVLQEYRAWLKVYAEQQKISLIDFYSPLVDPLASIAKSEYFFDEVHPNVQGYRVMADQAIKVLVQLI